MLAGLKRSCLQKHEQSADIFPSGYPAFYCMSMFVFVLCALSLVPLALSKAAFVSINDRLAVVQFTLSGTVSI